MASQKICNFRRNSVKSPILNRQAKKATEKRAVTPILSIQGNDDNLTERAKR